MWTLSNQEEWLQLKSSECTCHKPVTTNNPINHSMCTAFTNEAYVHTCKHQHQNTFKALYLLSAHFLNYLFLYFQSFVGHIFILLIGRGGFHLFCVHPVSFSKVSLPHALWLILPPAFLKGSQHNCISEPSLLSAAPFIRHWSPGFPCGASRSTVTI